MAKLKIKQGFSLRRLDLVAKGLANSQFLGNYKSVFKGTGFEFEDYRIYNPGNDDTSLIDWKASKRANQLMVKEFVEERNIEVIFLVDVSSQMLTGSSDKLKAEYIAEFVSTLSRSVLAAGDSAGLILFSNKIVREIKPHHNMVQYYSITKNLCEISNYGGYGDINVALDYIFKNGKEGSLVILVSDFIYGIGSERNLMLNSKKFDLIIVMIRDPRDLTLPEGKGEVILEDPYSGSTLLVTPDKIRKDYKNEVLRDINHLIILLKKYGGDFLFLQTDSSFVKEVVKFFKMREAKWR